jgi:hypothetical protein
MAQPRALWAPPPRPACRSVGGRGRADARDCPRRACGGDLRGDLPPPSRSRRGRPISISCSTKRMRWCTTKMPATSSCAAELMRQPLELPPTPLQRTMREQILDQQAEDGKQHDVMVAGHQERERRRERLRARHGLPAAWDEAVISRGKLPGGRRSSTGRRAGWSGTDDRRRCRPLPSPGSGLGGVAVRRLGCASWAAGYSSPAASRADQRGCQRPGAVRPLAAHLVAESCLSGHAVTAITPIAGMMLHCGM